MAAGTLTTGQLPHAIDRRVRKHFLDKYPTVEPMLDKVYKIEKQEDESEYEQDYQGLGQFEATSESETYQLDNFGEGYQTVFTPVKYTKRVPITYEAQKWDKSALTEAGNVGDEMAKAAADTVEEKGASPFLNAFDTSYTSYGDSKPLCSTDHTRPDGGTAQSNASANGVEFGHETLEDAMTEFRAQKNKRGRLVKVVPQVLLVPPELEALAIRVTKSKQKSGSSDQDTNPFNMREYYGGMMKIYVWEYLGAASGGTGTSWFLLDPRIENLVWKWADKPQVRKDDTTGKQNDTLYFLGMFYASYGWRDWVGLWGSAGDRAEYSD